MALTFCQTSHAQSGIDEFNAGHYEKALDYWTQGLERLPESPELNYNVGKLFDRGLGTDADITKATQYYLNAAKYDYAPAMFSLGVIMAKNGKFESAAKWWLKASKKDLPEAQYNLAKLYFDGVGVKQNMSMARFWYKKAAQSALTKYQLLSAVMHERD